MLQLSIIIYLPTIKGTYSCSWHLNSSTLENCSRIEAFGAEFTYKEEGRV